LIVDIFIELEAN